MRTYKPDFYYVRAALLRLHVIGFAPEYNSPCSRAFGQLQNTSAVGSFHYITDHFLTLVCHFYISTMYASSYVWVIWFAQYKEINF